MYNVYKLLQYNSSLQIIHHLLHTTIHYSNLHLYNNPSKWLIHIHTNNHLIHSNCKSSTHQCRSNKYIQSYLYQIHWIRNTFHHHHIHILYIYHLQYNNHSSLLHHHSERTNQKYHNNKFDILYFHKSNKHK